MITNSDRQIAIDGKKRHHFVNPAGIECEFYTFLSCPGAVSHRQSTDANTWFSGYRWSLAFCSHCFSHIGWHYEAMAPEERPVEFWGILCSHLSIR